MKKIVLPLLAFLLIIVGCKKMELEEAPRLFRPAIAGTLLADSNTIVASWQKVAGSKSYVLQVSTDSFRTVSMNMPMDTNVVVLKNLLFNQLYYLQVKAVAPDTSKNSRWSSLGSIKTLTSILKIPGLSDITFNSVRVSWTTKGAPVTAVKIVKASDNSTVANVNLTALDVTNEYRVVSGLAAATNYIIYLYSGTNERGFVNFTTKAPFSGNVIDLTGITGRPSVLADTLPLVASGSTILLKRGQTYNIASAINLSKSFIIISAPDLSVTDQAKIYFTSNFNFAASASIDSLEFNDVYMYSDNGGSRYVFNTTNGASVGKIKFVNSKVEIFRGILRLQSGATTISSYIIDNSTIDSIKDYGLLNAAASARVDNISITNSTIYKAEKVITSAQNSTSIIISDCTFNEAPLGNSTSYYIDYGALNVTNGITVNNCIFGIGKNSNNAFAVRDYRVGGTTIINAGINYRTSDHATAGNDFPNITTYSRTAVQLWLDPANGNFKINDNTFPGRSTTGALQWRL